MRVIWVSFDVVGRDCLEAAAAAGAQVVGVVTLPGPVRDDVSGMCRFDAVAERLGAALIETADVNAPETVEAVRSLAPDMIFVVGWSQLVRGELISTAAHGVYGMHPTLLPRHRGRAPIPWAIILGLARTGVTLFEIVDPTADSGPIIDQIALELAPDETATTLYERVNAAHLELVRRAVPALLAGTAARRPQDPRRASAWPKRTPADGIIDWETRAPFLDAWVRAQTRPYPGAFTLVGDEKLVVWRARPAPCRVDAPAGTVVEITPDGPLVRCGEDGLVLLEVEPSGLDDRLAPGLVLG